MALQKATNFKGLNAPSAYFEIVEMRSSKPGNVTTIAFLVHTDATKTNMLEMRAFDLPYDPDMTVAEAYTAMKQMPEFSGAADV